MMGEYEPEIVNVLKEIKDQLRRANEHRVTLIDCMEEINTTLQSIDDTLIGIQEKIIKKVKQ